MATVEEVFLRWAPATEINACQLWPSNRRHRNGYGYISIGFGSRRRRWLVHRYAWERTNGPIPDNMVIAHICDNPPCVNVLHLYLATQADNIHDAMAKHRLSLPPRSRPGQGAGGARLGTRNGHARLDEMQVLAIRQRYATGKVTQKLLAAEYSLTQAYVSKIVLRQVWCHI
jgi:hypothetical protein